MELLDEASALFARAVRRGLVSEACASETSPDAPGVVELDASGAPLRTSSSAEPLLEELSGATVEDGIRSAALQAVASATRAAIADGADDLPRLDREDVGGHVARPARSAARLARIRRGGGLHPAGAPDARRAAPPAGIRLDGAGAGGRATGAARRNSGAGGDAAVDLAAHGQRPPEGDLRQDRRPLPGELSATLFFGEHLPRIQHEVAVGDDASFVDAPRPRGSETSY